MTRTLAALLLLLCASHATAQARVSLEGVLDAELWQTDTGSNLLARNGGRAVAHGRMQLWGAVQPSRRVVVYAMAEGELDSGSDDAVAALELAAVRLMPSPRFQLDAGMITSPIGTFAARRFSWRNPLVGAPDGYPVQYPLGATLSGRVGPVDFRVGAMDLPAVHEGYTPTPTPRLRPVAAIGVTPMVGVRLGASFTHGPYLHRALTPGQLDSRRWDEYEQTIAGADLAWSVGYFELFAEAAHSRYEVPTRPDAIEGLTYYVEGKYTFTPRFFLATRLGRNDYPFIRPAGTDSWVARRTDFHDEEVGVGWRWTATTLLKASYRQDDWKVDGGNQAFVRPGGWAVALQLSQRFDVVELLRRRPGAISSRSVEPKCCSR